MREIMGPSDLAVRFELGRGGCVIPEAVLLEGCDIETALNVFNFEPVSACQVDAEFRCAPRMLHTDARGNRFETQIGANRTDSFTVRRATVWGALARRPAAFFIDVVTEGAGQLRVGDQVTELLRWVNSATNRPPPCRCWSAGRALPGLAAAERSRQPPLNQNG